MIVWRSVLVLGLVLGCGPAARGEADCNQNGVDDAIDIAGGESFDCDADGVPDECATPLGFEFPFRQGLRAGELPDGGFPQALIAKDLDGDGWVDFAIPRSTESTLAFLWNEGGKTFSRGEDVQVPYRPQDLAAVDLDGDGDLDLALGNKWALVPGAWHPEMAIVRNDGGRAFALDRVLELTEHPQNVAAGDFDGDGAVDLVFTHGTRWRSNEDWTLDSAVSILWNDGSGGFAAPDRLEMGGPATRSIYAVDLSGDGAADVLALHPNARPALRLSRGGRTFGPPVFLPEETGDGPFYAGFGDPDGDGDLDVALSHADTNRLTLLRNDGTGGLTFWAQLRESRDPDWPLFADLDRDGQLDLVGGAYYDGIWYGGADGFPAVREHVRYACGGGVMGRAVADVDRDGWPDLVTHNSAGTAGDWDDISVVYNRGDGTFAAPRLHYLYDVRRFWTGRPVRTIAADLDLDGHVDLASGRGETHRGFGVMISWGDGHGGFEEQSEIEIPNTRDEPISARSIAAADFDLDGDLDLVGAGAHGWLVAENRGEEGLIERARFEDLGRFFEHCVARDFDGDGRVDFAYSEDWDVFIVWNGGNWDFSTRQEVPQGEVSLDGGYVTGLGAGDWDRDGRIDLAIVQSWLSARMRVVLNRGERGFQLDREFAFDHLVPDLHVADLSGDGIDDLVVAEVPRAWNLNTTKETRVHVLLGDGRGGFELKATRPIKEFMPYVSSGDLDGDGDRDLLITGGSFFPSASGELVGAESQVEVLLNRGDGSLGRRVVLPFDSFPSGAIVEDFNGDGRPDLAVALRGSVMVAVALNEAPGPVTPSSPPPCGVRFLRGDARVDGELDGGDPRVILTYLFLGEGPTRCLDAADTNDDGRINVTDAIYLLNFILFGGPILPPPYPECGEDPTSEDGFDCEEYAGCPG